MCILVQEPLVYINVAFEPRIATSMKVRTGSRHDLHLNLRFFFVLFCSGEQQEIYLDEAQRLNPEEAKAAIFYSIVTTQPGTDTSAGRRDSKPQLL